MLKHLTLFCVVAASLTGRSALAQDSPMTKPTQLTKEWKPLLNKSLNGWEVFTGVPHRSLTVPGLPPGQSEDGTTGEPIGLGDPLKIFRIETVDGEQLLRVNGKCYAGLTSQASFSNYHLQFEYKWGEKKYAPRLDNARDSGVLIHCTGEHGKFWNVWKRCLECQVQEGDTGDFYALGGTSGMVKLLKLEDGRPPTGHIGTLASIGNGTNRYGAQKYGNFEKTGDWNTVDIYTVGEEGAFEVNGHRVMRIWSARNGNQETGDRLTAGQIQIQSEAAEIDYRRIRIRHLDEIPKT